MARHLLKRQKKVIDSWIESQVNSEMDRMITGNIFKTGGRLGIEDLPREVWDKLEEINDTEILWQEVNRYISDKTWDIVLNS
jgi:hypothetical protein